MKKILIIATIAIAITLLVVIGFKSKSESSSTGVVKLNSNKTTVIPVLGVKTENAGWFELDFKPKVEIIVAPIEVKVDGGIGLDVLEENKKINALVTVGIYKDKDCKIAVIDELNSYRGVNDYVDIEKGNYYVKFTMERTLNRSETLKFNFQLMTAISENLTLKKDVAYYSYLKESDTYYYEINVTEPSKVSIDMKPYYGEGMCNFQLLDSTKNEISFEQNSQASSQNSSIFSYSIAKGTYYVKVTDASHGMVTLKYTSEPLTNDFSNTSKETAMKLTEDNEINGMFLITDESTKEYWYISDIPENPHTSVDTHGFGSFTLDIIDQNGEIAYTDSKKMGGKGTGSHTLGAGTYYIRVTNSENCSGTYTVIIKD